MELLSTAGSRAMVALRKYNRAWRDLDQEADMELYHTVKHALEQSHEFETQNGQVCAGRTGRALLEESV
jgi:hypothetical protein